MGKEGQDSFSNHHRQQQGSHLLCINKKDPHENKSVVLWVCERHWSVFGIRVIFFEVPPKLCQTATSLWNNCANNSSQEILRVSSPQISGRPSEKNLPQFHLLSHALGEVSHSIYCFFSWWRCRCIMMTSKRNPWTPVCNAWTLSFLSFLEI